MYGCAKSRVSLLFLGKSHVFSCKDHVISPWNNPRSNPAWGLGFCNHPHRMVLTSYKVYKLVSATGLAIVLSINLRIQPLLCNRTLFQRGPNGAPSCPPWHRWIHGRLADAAARWSALPRSSHGAEPFERQLLSASPETWSDRAQLFFLETLKWISSQD